jgi:hypothetical protein
MARSMIIALFMWITFQKFLECSPESEYNKNG